jgi:signal transduction histidine kinase/CheY-like chemotaxis protein
VICLLMTAIYRPVEHVTQWAREYYTLALSFQKDTRQHKMELEQALQGLTEANSQLSRLNQLTQGLRQMADEARAAKEQFVANVSHELRTPLNMIIGFVEMILQSPQTYGKKIPPKLLADLNVIQRNAEHLLNLINDVLDLSQIENEQMALTKEMLPFCEIIEFATTAVMPLYRQKGLSLTSEIAPEIGEVYCDRTRLREVLLNLLSNAGRFTESGGVHIQARRDNADLLVTVTDTGPGIAAEDINRIFQPFEQLDPSIRRRYGGTGLGLAISKRFVEAHGGKIWAESQKGVGTTFSFRIPLEQPLPLPSDNAARWISPYMSIEERAHLPRPAATKALPQVVVSESGQMLRRLLERYLGNVQIVPVASVDEAQRYVAEYPAQAVLVNNPSIGLAWEEIHRQPSQSVGVPTIFCSLPDPSESSAHLGVDGLLVKPIQRTQLLGTLEDLGITHGTVLIVDDEPDALQLFGRMLASAAGDYRVLLASDGEEALHILEEYRPDVILLDLVMPHLDGFQFLEQRRQTPEWRQIPIIVISARDPAGHPIVSRGLAVVQPQGLSVRQLIACIQAIMHVLSGSDVPADPAQPAIPPG